MSNTLYSLLIDRLESALGEDETHIYLGRTSMHHLLAGICKELNLGYGTRTLDSYLSKILEQDIMFPVYRKGCFGYAREGKPKASLPAFVQFLSEEQGRECIGQHCSKLHNPKTFLLFGHHRGTGMYNDLFGDRRYSAHCSTISMPKWQSLCALSERSNNGTYLVTTDAGYIYSLALLGAGRAIYSSNGAVKEVDFDGEVFEIKLRDPLLLRPVELELSKSDMRKVFLQAEASQVNLGLRNIFSFPDTYEQVRRSIGMDNRPQLGLSQPFTNIKHVAAEAIPTYNFDPNEEPNEEPSVKAHKKPNTR